MELIGNIWRPTTLFLDIGGVLLTNGWDRTARRKAAEEYGLDYDEMNERHHLTYDTYEAGKISLDEYLDRIVFYESRTFNRNEFIDFMFAQSEPFEEMIDVVRILKSKYKLKIGVISNEGRELTEYRISKFYLNSFVDFFVSSCFVHVRKPDKKIFQMALDMAQVFPDKCLYIDDRSMFVEIARDMGMRSVHHLNFNATNAALSLYGLRTF
jgi:putative hydrolase of the HAD superfamily